jgi:hypothetical protein
MTLYSCNLTFSLNLHFMLGSCWYQDGLTWENHVSVQCRTKSNNFSDKQGSIHGQLVTKYSSCFSFKLFRYLLTQYSCHYCHVSLVWQCFTHNTHKLQDHATHYMRCSNDTIILIEPQWIYLHIQFGCYS